MKNKLSFICLIVAGLLLSSSAFCASEKNPTKTMTTSKYTLSYEQIKMAAESGDADAQYALGYMYYYGKGGAPKDVALAKNWIGKSANQKQPQAMKALALMNAHRTSESSSSNQQNVQTTSTQTAYNTPMSENKPKVVREEDQKMTAVNDNDAAKTGEKMTLVDMRNKKINDEAPARDEPMVSANGQFTIQVLGASNKEPIVKMVRDHHLNQAKIYRTVFNNKDWYVLIYGQYKNKEDAKTEAKRLENSLGVKPWVKPYASVKKFKLTTIS